MKTLLTCNLSTKTARAGNEVWTPPPYRFGEQIILALRFTEERAGVAVEPDLQVAALRAAIGRTDTRPESGKFALQFGDGPQTTDNTIDPIAWDGSPASLRTAIAAKTAITTAYGAPIVTKQDDTWRIVFGEGAQEVPITVRDNTLFPVSFARTDAYPIDGQWQHFVRLLQAEVAFTSSSERVLPPPPYITAVTDGGSEGEFEWNEIQRLHVPPDFRSSYIIRSGASARTAELTIEDGVEQIQAALEAVLGSGNAIVTPSLNFSANIEFTGDLAATDVPLMEVEALAPPPGDLTFTLALDRAELASILRRVESVTLPLQVWLSVTLEDETPQEIVAFTTNVTILRPLVWPEQGTLELIDWLRPPSPKDYKPFNPDNVITGQRFYSELVGNEEATTFVIDHDLATDLVHVWVRENVSNGYQLREGTDFRVRVTSADTVTIHALENAPAANAWRVTIVSAQTVGAFADGLNVEIAQVNGLQDFLDSLGGRLSNLEELLPSGAPINTDAVAASASSFKRVFPVFRLEAPPASRNGGGSALTSVPAAIKQTKTAEGNSVETSYAGTIEQSVPRERVRYFPLSPLVTAASVEATPKSGQILEPDPVEEGRVYAVAGAELAAARVAGREMIRFADGDKIAYANGHWFKVRGASGAWWATECEADLFLAPMSADQWEIGHQWQLKFEPTLVLASRTKVTGRCRLTVQTATYTSLAAATDFASLTWTDAVSTLIALSDVPTPVVGWAALNRTGAGIIAGSFKLGGKAANFAGTTANLAVRLRVSEFDFAGTGARGSFIVALDSASDTLVPI